MKAKDHICLGNLSFGIFRVPQLRYQGGGAGQTPRMGQYLKKPASNRVKGPFLVFRIDYKGHWHVTFDVINFEKKRS